MKEDILIVERYLNFLLDIKNDSGNVYSLSRKHKLHCHIYDALKEMNLITKDSYNKYRYIGEEPTIELASELKRILNKIITSKYGKKSKKIVPNNNLKLAEELALLYKRQNEIKIRISYIIKELNQTT